MATFWIEEYEKKPRNKHGDSIAAPNPTEVVNQKMTVGAEADSATLNAETEWVRVHTDNTGGVNYSVGTAPTASATTQHLAAGVYLDLYVGKNSGVKISCVAV